MSVITGLLEAIRGKRKAKFASKAAEYDSFVTALAKGDEVDVDELATLLDDLDKSDSDLEADIKAKQRRAQTAAEIERLRGVERELQKTEQELQRLQGEIDRFLAERKPKIEALAEQARFQRADADRVSILESDLKTVGIPLHIQQKKNELHARRMAWGVKQRQYDDEIKQPRELIRQHNNILEVIDEKLRRAAAADRPQLLEERAKAEQERQRYQATIDALSGDKSALDAELREIEAAERQLSSELLKP